MRLLEVRTASKVEEAVYRTTLAAAAVCTTMLERLMAHLLAAVVAA